MSSPKSFVRRATRFFRLAWMGRVALWPAAMLGLVSPTGRSAKRKPRVSLEPEFLETRETPQDLVSVLRSGFALSGMAALGGQLDASFETSRQELAPNADRAAYGGTTTAHTGDADHQRPIAPAPLSDGRSNAASSNDVQSERAQDSPLDVDWLDAVGDFLNAPPDSGSGGGGSPSSSAGDSDGGGAGPSSSGPLGGGGGDGGGGSAPGTTPSENGALSQTTSTQTARSSPGQQPVASTVGERSSPSRPKTSSATAVAPAAPVNGGSSRTPSNEVGENQSLGTNERAQLAADYGRTKLGFEINQGQAASQVRVQSRGAGFGFWLTDNAMVFGVSRPAEPQDHNDIFQGERARHSSLGRDVFRLRMVDANPRAELVLRDELQTRSNYFIGSDPTQWHTDVPQYGRVEYRDIFPGVDLALHSQSPDSKVFEYDFIVKPGADAESVRLRWEGLEQIDVDQRGRLLLHTGGGTVVQDSPLIYQETRSDRTHVAGRYVLRENNEIGFEITGDYDRSRAITIDPVIGFGSYLGGSGYDEASSIAVDLSGNTYVAGQTGSLDFPLTDGYDFDSGGGNTFVSKLAASGDQLVYSTYLGGPSGDWANGLAVDLAGSAYLTGHTYGGSFPTTPGAYQTSVPGADYAVFVSKLSAAGDALLYSTLLGGTSTVFQAPTGIAVDALGYAYVTGETDASDFPTTSGAFQTSTSGDYNAFVTKLNRTGTGLVHSTYLRECWTGGIAINGAGDVFVAGGTDSSSFTTTTGAYQPTWIGLADSFVAKLTADFANLAYSTFLGGSGGDCAYEIAVGKDGKAYVVGQTGGSNDAFIKALSPSGASLVYSTYLGGDSPDVAKGIAVDAKGYATVGGSTLSSNFPTYAAFQGSLNGVMDGFVAKLTPAGTVVYSSYLGGSGVDAVLGVALDPRGMGYLTGVTNSSDLPGMDGYQTANAGGYDAFVAKLAAPAPKILSISSDTGSSSTDKITTDQTLNISGTALANLTVTLERADLGLLGSVQADGDGDWSYDYTATTLAEGTYDFVARATDVDGMKSDYSAPEFPVTVDRTGPSVTLSAPTSTPSRGLEVRVVARDLIGVPAGATVTLDVDLNNDSDFLDGGEANYATGNLVDGHVSIKLPTLSGPGTYPVRARVTDLAGNEGTSSSGNVVVTSVTSAWTATAKVLSVDPVTGDWQTQLGDVSLRHELDLDRSPGSIQSGSPALVYHSASVSQKPIVQVTLPSVNNASLPGTITAELTFDGVTQSSPVTFDTTGFAPGDDFSFALQADQAITTTGRYGYSVLVQVPGETDQTVYGSTFVVAQDSSPFGAGWEFAGVDRLVSIAADANGPAGMLRVYGTGGYRFYEGSATFSSPAGDNGALSLTGGTYTYATPDGQVRTFNSDGLQTGWTSADGKETLAYRYDGSDRLEGITAIDGGLTTFTYDSGEVVIETVNGRLTTLALDGSGDLATVTNPDDGLRTLTYDSHRLTREEFGLQENNWEYTSTGVVGTYTWGAVSVNDITNESRTTYQPALTRGIDTLVSGTVFASETDPTGHTDAWELDATGQFFQHVAPDGALTRRTYSTGYLATETDPLGRTTTYTRDAEGYVTQTTYPGGSLVTNQYQSAFHALTTMINERGDTTTYAYDGGGHQVRSTDELGRHTTYNYNATTGLLDSEVDPRGGITTYEYDGNRRLTRTIDPLGNGTSYAYDSNGNQNKTTDALLRVTTTVYDAMGRKTSTTDALSKITTTTYDASGLVLTTVDPMSKQTSTVYDSFKRGLVVRGKDGVGTGDQVGQLWGYDAAGRETKARDAAGWTVSSKYDPAGRVIETADALGATTKTVYNAAGEKTAERDAMGRWTYYAYDARGRKTSVTDNLGNVTSTTYDAAGNVTGETNALGHTTTFVYDAAMQQTVEIDPLGRRTTITHDAAGNVSTVTDPLGRVTSFAYDAMNRQTQETNAVGTAAARTRATSYDAVGNVRTTTDGLGNVTTHAYDAVNRRTETIDPMNHRVTTTYDAAGNPTTTKDSLGKVTTYSYDALHRRVGQTDPLGHTATVVLDAEGRPAGRLDAAGNVTAAANDPRGRPWGSLDDQGAFQFDIYDGAGGVRLVVDPQGNEWHYVLDRVGRQTLRFDPEGAVTTTAYDATGRVTAQTDRTGRIIQHTYNAADQVTSSVWKNAAGVTVNLLTYTYDNAGNRLTAQDSAGTVTYTYDEFNRAKTYTNVFGQVLTYAYDAEDRSTQRDDSLSGVQTSTYNAMGLLTSRQFGGGGQTQARVDLGYSDRYEPSSITRYGNLTGTMVLGTSVYSRDDAGHLTSLVNKDNAGATLSYYTYTYDSSDRVTAHTWSSQVGTFVYSGTRTYTYDLSKQMANDGTTTYTYDFNGNRDMSGYETGPANRLTNDGVFTYTHDAEGNLTQKSKGSGLETWYYAYDNANHLTTVRKTSDGTTNALLLTYTYDVEGKRVKEQSWGGTGPAETRFAYDRDNIWADLDSGNTVTVRRVFGDGPDQALTRTVASGPNAGLWFYQTDVQGSVRDLVNASSQVGAHLDYDGYGVRTDPQSSVSDRYGYTAREWQADTGIQHNRARDFIPSVGKWMQEDPIAFAAGDFNLTRYVHNNPTNATDPSGLFAGLDLAMAYNQAIDWAAEAYLDGEGVGGVIEGFWAGLIVGLTEAYLTKGTSRTPSIARERMSIANQLAATERYGFSNRHVLRAAPDSTPNGGQQPTPNGGQQPTPSGERPPQTLQTGGNTMQARTARELGLERREAGRALERLKHDNSLPNDHHGRIMNNGDYCDSGTGRVLGNIFDYVD